MGDSFLVCNRILGLWDLRFRGGEIKISKLFEDFGIFDITLKCG